MAKPADPSGKGYWRCPWSECATFTGADEERATGGEEFAAWLTALVHDGARADVLAAPAGALLAAFYAG